MNTIKNIQTSTARCPQKWADHLLYRPLRRNRNNSIKEENHCLCVERFAAVTCGECYKPQGVYSQAKLNAQEASQVASIKESNLYTCGSPLFPPGSIYEMTVVVRGPCVLITHRSTILQLCFGTFPACVLLLWPGRGGTDR